MKECNVAEIRTVYSLDDTGVWGEPVRHKKPIILNDFHAAHPAKKGFPAGHVRVDRFLAIPVFYQDSIVATVGVANKESDYTEIDCLHLTLLTESVWIHIEQMKIEQERTHLQQQLLQSQKLEAVGRLAGGVAHDFNNMLGVIIGHTDLAMLHTPDDDPLRKDLNQIRNAANRSADLTRQLLAYARKQIAKPKVVNLNSLVETMQQMLRRLISEDIDLLWIPGEDLWPVRIDPAQVDQIVANLVVNARDAVDSAGSITIQTRNISVQEFDQIDHPERVPGDYVLLTVRDTGMGMSPETLERIFEPFYTTKEQGKGTGLGLATVYGIVRQNEGFIDVESVSGQGSCFSVYLRRHIDPQVAKEGSPAEPHLASGHETILLVEDEEVVLRLAQQMLEHLGYTVFTARTAGEAITRMREQAGAIDLLVTDVIMPSMNGRELKEQLEALHPGLKCLFMSGYPADVIARQGVLDEEIQFIPKPFTLNSLSEKVRLALNQK
jgi:signal transduction histidine kinase/CheY-like chemotaxis protein